MIDGLLKQAVQIAMLHWASPKSVDASSLSRVLSTTSECIFDIFHIKNNSSKGAISSHFVSRRDLFEMK